MTQYVCIHGHFYQPPREDPKTGKIPNQPSAAPFDNWNDRILKECYMANTEVEIVDVDVVEIFSADASERHCPHSKEEEQGPEAREAPKHKLHGADAVGVRSAHVKKYSPESPIAPDAPPRKIHLVQ